MVGANSNDYVVARFNANGSVDTTFGTNGKTVTDFRGSYDKALAVAVQSDGKIVVVGQSRDSSSNYDMALVRYTAAGVLDTTFGTGGKVTTDFGSTDDAASDLSILPNGQILVGGRGGTTATGYDFALGRYNSDGTLDTTFGSNGTGKVLTDFGHGEIRRTVSLCFPPDKFCWLVGLKAVVTPWISALLGTVPTGSWTLLSARRDWSIPIFPVAVIMGKLRCLSRMAIS